MLHFTPLIRNLALRHAASRCLDEQCLLCELGFLFDMLQKAEGSTCQATNMLRALSSLPQGQSGHGSMLRDQITYLVQPTNSVSLRKRTKPPLLPT